MAAHLTVFQRTPNLALPMRQEEARRRHNPHRMKEGPNTTRRTKSAGRPSGGFDYQFLDKSACEVSKDERAASDVRTHLGHRWRWRPWVRSFNAAILTDERSNRAALRLLAPTKRRARIKESRSSPSCSRRRSRRFTLMAPSGPHLNRKTSSRSSISPM